MTESMTADPALHVDVTSDEGWRPSPASSRCCRRCTWWSPSCGDARQPDLGRRGDRHAGHPLDLPRNGLLLAAGDLLTGDQGLTSARWQVLGAIALAQRPLTVPQIARRMGLTRQSVHPTVGRLVRDGLLALAPTADHRRSPLVCLTEPGRATYSAIDRRQAAWVHRLAGGTGRADLETAARLEELCRRLEADDAQDTPTMAAEKEEETMPTAPEPAAPTEAAAGRPRRRR